MSHSFMLPRDKSEIDEQLEAIKTPLDKIDFLEVLSHELRNKIDWMKRKEAEKEPGNKVELSNRQEVLYAEKHVNRQKKKLQIEHKKELERRKKLAWPGQNRLLFPVAYDQDTYMNHESQIETKRRKHDWCLWLRQGLIKNEGDDWRFKDNILRQARLDAIDQGETDDEILWCCLSVNQEFVDFLDIQKVNPSTQPPTGRGKKATPELHKVIWRAYRYASTTIAENPTAQEVWDSLRADPMMFDPKSIIIEDSFSDDEFFYQLPNFSEPKSYKRISLDTRLNLLKKNPLKI